jgi:hypothetical protein
MKLALPAASRPHPAPFPDTADSKAAGQCRADCGRCVSENDVKILTAQCPIPDDLAFVAGRRKREFLKEQSVLEPAEFRIARIVGEQRASYSG